MASIRKRGKAWFVEVRVRGQVERQSFSSAQAARQWAAETEEEIRQGRPAASRCSLRQAFDRYAAEISPTKAGGRWEQVRLLAFSRSMRFVDEPISSITPDDLSAWRDMRLENVTPGSVIRELALVGDVFETARREWRWIRANPVRDVRRPPAPPPRNARIREDQAAMIFAVASYVRGRAAVTQQQLAAAAFDLSLETAMRAGEIRGLRGPDLHLAERFVRLPKTKNGSQRDVPLSAGAIEILKALDAQEPFPISAAVLDATFRTLKKRAGIDGIHFHDARATAITRLAKKLDVHDLARMTGHKDLKMLLVYYRATASEIAQRL